MAKIPCEKCGTPRWPRAVKKGFGCRGCKGGSKKQEKSEDEGKSFFEEKAEGDNVEIVPDKQ